MKRTFTLTLELDADEDQGPFNRDANGHALYERINGIFNGTFEGARISGVREDIGLETPRMLVLSTAHITHRTSLILDGKRPGPKPLLFPKGEHGWIIPIIDPLGADADEDARWSLPEIRAIRELAEANGCTWIMLDQAADTIEALPIYEW